MQVIVQVTRAELDEMEAAVDRLKQGVINALDRGLEDGEGTVFLSGFNVDIQVID